MKKQNKSNLSDRYNRLNGENRLNQVNGTNRINHATNSNKTNNRFDKKNSASNLHGNTNVYLDQSDIAMQREAKLRAVDRRKARSRSVTMTLFALIIMIITVLIILNIMKQTAPKPQFMFIQNGVLEHTVGSTGLLIRDEVLMKAPANGTVRPLIEEGNRVSFGQDIAIIIDQSAEESLSALKNCEQQISDLQRDLINQGKGPGARVIYEEADKDIAELINLARKDSIQGSLLNMNSYETSIAVLLERRDTRLLSIDFKDSRLNELKAQKIKLEKTLGLLSGTIKSQTSGIVSYHIDGMEELFETKNIQSLTVEQYQKFQSESKIYITTESTIKKDAPIVRITSGIYQYIAFLLPNTSIDSFKADSIHTIKIPMDGTTIQNCQVIKTEAVGSGLFVVFKTDRQLDRFSDRRIIQADITIKSTEGLKIPVSSIIGFDKNNKTGEIMIVSNGYARIAKINILDYNDGEYVIIEGVKDQKYSPALNGYLVKNPESVQEGENIGGANK